MDTTTFRRGVVVSIGGSFGYIQELITGGVADGVPIGIDILFKFADGRFVDTDVTRCSLSFGAQYRAEGDTITRLREPVVSDILVYSWTVEEGALRIASWTFASVYKAAEDMLTR